MSQNVEKPSQKQLDLLNKLGYKGKTPFSKEDASKLISKQLTIQQANQLRDSVDYNLTDQVAAITNESIGLYSYVLTKCVEVGIYEPPLIGMLFKDISEKVEKTKK